MAVQKTETFIPSVKFNKLTKEQYDQAVLNGEIQPTEFYLVEELNDNFGDMAKSVYDPENKEKPYIPADEALDKATYGGSTDGVVIAADRLQTPRAIGNANFDGMSDLTLEQIGAEPAFEKKSAFNKDFGSAAGTVCQGNDGRLSDARRASNITMSYNGNLYITYR